MQNSAKILFKKIDTKTVAWFQDSNQYVILENATAKILKKLHDDIPIEKIAETLAGELRIPLKESIDFILDIEKQLFLANVEQQSAIIPNDGNYKTPKTFNNTKYYKINGIVFKVDFESEIELFLVHPKFAHLEILETQKFDFLYQVFTQNNNIFLLVNHEFIGSWDQKEIHFFQGKFSMQIVQHIHQKGEKEWLGVFHASAVSDGKNTILFLGDSGNGKSTSLALLQANGFTCLADDFVPVDVENQNIFSFPAAISIKKNSLSTLLPFYPQLEKSTEFHLKRLNKVVRYLPPNTKNYKESLPCNALVFIKYEKNSDLHFNKISSLIAFEKLIPDSWLSPLKENASVFLEWFSHLPSYELIYSNTNEMIEVVSKIFHDDL